MAYLAGKVNEEENEQRMNSRKRNRVVRICTIKICAVRLNPNACMHQVLTRPLYCVYSGVTPENL